MGHFRQNPEHQIFEAESIENTNKPTTCGGGPNAVGGGPRSVLLCKLGAIPPGPASTFS